MYKSKNQLSCLFYFTIIVLSASCTNKLSSVNTNPEKGFEIIQADFDDVNDAIYEGIGLTFPGNIITPLAGKTPGFNWFHKPLLDQTNFKLEIYPVKGINNDGDELNGYIYEMQTHGSQGLVKGRYLNPLVKNINNILKDNGIEKNYVTSYEKVKIQKTNKLFQTSSDEKPQAIVLQTVTLGNIKDTTQQILQNTLENELKKYFKLISQEIFEKAQEKAFQELDYEECTEDQCIMFIQEMLQVEHVFHLQIIEEEGDTQLSLSWKTLDEKKNQADICMGCSTIKLNKRVISLIENINK